MTTDWAIHVNDIVTACGIVLATVTFVVAYLYGKRKDHEDDNRQNYQRLELASIDVFQNEIDHPELSQIWINNRDTLAAGARPLHFYDAFLYQQVNLFEMAYSFCEEGELDPEILGSWVLWYANVCRSPYFRDFWARTEAPQNYIHGFQRIMNKGCEIYKAGTYTVTGQTEDMKQRMKEKHRQFFSFVAKQLNSKELETWIDRT